jgi:hypothetical protein
MDLFDVRAWRGFRGGGCGLMNLGSVATRS